MVKQTKASVEPVKDNAWDYDYRLPAMLLSFAIVFLAIGVGLHMKIGNEHSSSGRKPSFSREIKRDLGPLPILHPPIIYEWPVSSLEDVDAGVSSFSVNLDASWADAYRRDGTIAIRGLLSEDLLKRLQLEGNDFLTKSRRNVQFRTNKHNVLLNISGPVHQSAFAQVALNSLVPAVAKELLGMQNSTTLRVMRDIWIAKDANDSYVCGYHTDDFGFWPAMPEHPGVNAWIALDDTPLRDSANFALAIGSHRASWKNIAQEVTGASTTFPSEGYRSASDMFRRRTGLGTCNLEQAVPDINDRMEKTRRIYDLKAGDVIFHDRWLFHRTFVDGKGGDVFRRYSIRYNAGDAIIPPGYGTELSVLSDKDNGGKTADEVVVESGPWYPRASPWDLDELAQLAILRREKLPVALSLQKARKEEMRPYQRQLAGKLNRKPPTDHSREHF